MLPDVGHSWLFLHTAFYIVTCEVFDMSKVY